MRPSHLIVSLLFLVTFAQSQQSTPDRSFEQGRVFIGKKSTDVMNVNIHNGMVFYNLKNSDVVVRINLNDVNEIQEFIPNPSSAGKWIGGIAGFGIGVGMALSSAKTESDTKDMGGGVQLVETKKTISLWPIYTFSIVGYFIGMTIDAQAGDWVTVHQKGISHNFDIDSDQQFHSIALRYTVKF
ncbi:MAG: hypothetical protein WCW40_10525 [Bacteroidota bacterium]